MQIPVLGRKGKTKPWSSIPRINNAHPLAKGLVFYAYDTGGGLVIDLVSGMMPTRLNSPNPTNKTSPFGSGLNYVSAGGSLVWPAISAVNSIFTSKLYSLACAWYITTLPSVTFTCPFGINQTPGGQNVIACLLGSSASNDMDVAFANVNGTPFTANTINAFHSMVGTNTSATAQNIYYDGALKTTSATTATFTTTTARACFNTFDPVTVSSGNGVIGWVYYGAIWDRTITAAEAFQLHNDPYCFLLYPEDDVFATLVGAAAAVTMPFMNNDSFSLNRQRQGTIADKSVSLNPNLFKNPIPIFNQFEPAKPFCLPLALPIPPLPLNINLFTNPYPFNQIDWSKPFRVPLALPQPAIGINPNIFTNPYPFAQYDWSKPVRSPLALPTPPLPLNINIFTNPYPFNQTDWSKPIKVPQAPYSPTDPLNINLFTNPFPVLNLDTPRPSGVRGAKSPDIPYNQNLYTVTVVTAPFYAAEIFPARRQVAAPLPDQPLNINLFTNPIPIFNSDQSSTRPLRGTSSPDVAYNQNIYSVTVVISLPFNQYDWPVAQRLKSSQPLPDPLNINLFTNPFPVFNSDQSSSRPFPRVPPLDAAYNQNLYSVTIVTAPFYAAEIFPVRRPVSSPLSDPPLNINIFTNPFPIFNSDQSSSRSLPRITPFDPPLNIGLLTSVTLAPMPFSQYDFTPSHFPAPRIVVDLPNLTILISVAPGAPPEVYNRPFFATVGQLMNIS